MRDWFQTMAVRCGCLLLVTLACLSHGCAQLDVDKSFSIPFFGKDKDKPKTPSRVVTVWVDTIRYTQGMAPTRGFGGRLVFYEEGEKEPIKVEGDLVIYAFEEDGRKAADPRPTRKYVFRADQLDAHHSESKVGHSYSFFVPWDDVGGYRKEISLIARFQPKSGSTVVSEQTKHILPGKPSPEEMQAAQAELAPLSSQTVQPASFNTSPAEIRRRMLTATIAVPQTFGQQIPKAEVRERFTRSQPQAPAAAEQALPEQQTQPTQPAIDSQLSRSLPQASPDAQPKRGRVRSQPNLAKWQSPARLTPAKANASESN